MFFKQWPKTTIRSNHQQRIAVIGSGFAAISAACYLEKAGYSVDIYEKNETMGGRARQFATANSYLFDMGASWYWIPEVFERFFADFGYQTEGLYILKQLDPGFSVIFGLANTLMQTANLKPSIKNKHLNNLFYTGQLTVPGPCVPPSIISGKVAAQQMINLLKSNIMKARFDTLSATCSKATTKLYSTSFSLGIYFLNKELRQPIYAIYGFVRLADEIVDSFHDYDKRVLLAELRADCFEAIERGISLNPVLNSFQQTVNRYHIKHELIEQFLKSMEMDLEQRQYTADQYEQYVLGSAQVVGLMCLQVFTGGDEAAYLHLKGSAMKLGSAFQKVNFLRDLKADFQDLNRAYFPGINMEHFSNSDKAIIEKEIREEFEAALSGIRLLPRSSRKGVYLAFVYYKKLFDKITKTTADRVMSERIRVSNGLKFFLMFDSLLRHKLNVL